MVWIWTVLETAPSEHAGLSTRKYMERGQEQLEVRKKPATSDSRYAMPDAVSVIYHEQSISRAAVCAVINGCRVMSLIAHTDVV